MLDIVHPLIEGYLTEMNPPRDAQLAAMEKRAAVADFPIIGPEVGRLLMLLTRWGGARRVLELGSGFGYSAYWFALGLPDDGRVVCTDQKEENGQAAEASFAAAGLAHKLEFRIGEALALASELSGPFDIVFNDIDKEDYRATIDTAHRLLRSGGLFITDNTLWYGRILDTKPDKTSQAVLEFNRALRDHPDFEASILPLRDGVTVALKR